MSHFEFIAEVNGLRVGQNCDSVQSRAVIVEDFADVGNFRTRAKEDHHSSREGGRTMVTVDMEEEWGEVEDK